MPEKDTAAYNMMIDVFVKLGDVDSARSLFDQMPERSVVSWTSMIDGYCNVGDVVSAKLLFDEIPEKNLYSWNAMIGGYCRNKESHEALQLFRELQAETLLEPDNVTIVSVLPAVADLGALDLGCWIHNYVRKKELDKYANVCTALVDISRCLEEAEKLIKVMPYEINEIILSTFLSACNDRKDVARAERILKKMATGKAWSDGNYIMLRNLYALERRWGDVREIKGVMRRKGTKKEVGCSSIEVDSRVQNSNTDMGLHVSIYCTTWIPIQIGQCSDWIWKSDVLKEHSQAPRVQHRNTHKIPSKAAGSSSKPPQPYEQDQLLPIANVARIMKEILPANAEIAKEGKETMQECVSEFISFVTGLVSTIMLSHSRVQVQNSNTDMGLHVSIYCTTWIPIQIGPCSDWIWKSDVLKEHSQYGCYS
ncbi:hypothetical protein ACET3Z_031375 [Daucus carota]